MSDHLQTSAAMGFIKSMLVGFNIAFWVSLTRSLLSYRPTLLVYSAMTMVFNYRFRTARKGPLSLPSCETINCWLREVNFPSSEQEGVGWPDNSSDSSGWVIELNEEICILGGRCSRTDSLIREFEVATSHPARGKSIPCWFFTFLCVVGLWAKTEFHRCNNFRDFQFFFLAFIHEALAMPENVRYINIYEPSVLVYASLTVWSCWFSR